MFSRADEKFFFSHIRLSPIRSWLVMPWQTPRSRKLSTSLPAQFPEIEEKLSTAWNFLSGETRRFSFCEGMALQGAKDSDRRIVLPISLHDANHLAAIALLIDKEDAEKLAASMFGILRKDLVEEDIADACAEACNVLSGAIIEYLSAHDHVEIGLPKSIGAAGYQSVLHASGIKAYSEGRSDKHQLTLVVFDPLIETKHQESK